MVNLSISDPFVFLWIFPYLLMQQVWYCSFSTFRGHRQKFLNYDVFLSLKVVLLLANSKDSDEM